MHDMTMSKSLPLNLVLHVRGGPDVNLLIYCALALSETSTGVFLGRLSAALLISQWATSFSVKNWVRALHPFLGAPPG